MKKICCFLLVLAAACKESYDPPVKATNHAYLVVEGFINNGPDTTFITLSRTFSLRDTVPTAPELYARVFVQGTDNSSYPLLERGKGTYFAPGLALNNALQYKLRILTNDGKEYQSDYVSLKASPPIDSIGWTKTSDGIQLYVNTHDPQNASTYYRWDYTETWQFHSVYYSQFEYLPLKDTIVYRPVDSFYTCWKTDYSSRILLASAARLSQDQIYQAPLVQIPQDSWEIALKYSILVKQYVLTPDAYNFWLNLQRNTELIGTVFSPQPSEIKGNIHSLTDTAEQVVGYISAGTLRQKRIFITPDQLSAWHLQSYTNTCTTFSIPSDPDSERFYLRGMSSIPTVISQGSIRPPYRYDIADRYCVDCTLLGTNVKPYFWQ